MQLLREVRRLRTICLENATTQVPWYPGYPGKTSGPNCFTVKFLAKVMLKIILLLQVVGARDLLIPFSSGPQG
eukprot:2001963-Rhodomonas_salina.1